MAQILDPVSLSVELVKIPSVTPLDEGALSMLQSILQEWGFVTHRLKFDDVDNLYARFGTISPNFCFAGHTDVVPTGDLTKWTYPPFSGTIKDGTLFSRGAADMKSAIAAFIVAAQKYISKQGVVNGSISLLITGDEEGHAINGTKKLLAAIEEMGEKIDHCIVGEPTCPLILGDMIKNGRRGSLNCTINSNGTQGHVAYPDKASNPIPPLIEFLHQMQTHIFDEGADGFQPTNLEIVTIDVGNPATNVIPQSASARFNIRFNTNHSGESLTNWIEEKCAKINASFDGDLSCNISVSGEPFFTAPSKFTQIIQDAAYKVTGIKPQLSTTGGTSDARFIKNHCPVCEFGIVGATLHQINENVEIKDIYSLTDIYEEILVRYFEKQD